MGTTATTKPTAKKPFEPARQSVGTDITGGTEKEAIALRHKEEVVESGRKFE